MKIKETCDRIIEIYEKPDVEKQDRRMAVKLICKLRIETEWEDFTNDDLTSILETAKNIASTKKNFKHVLEKELLSLISYLPHELWMNDDDDDDETQKNEEQIAESLINFATEIFEIKLDRDSFAGKRRGYSIQILASLSSYFEVPEFMELCSKSISSKSKIEFLDSIECLKDYCLERDEVPSEDIISIIDKRIEKTKNRMEASCGLNLQVETGLISEFEALSRLDDWKSKNYSW